MLVTKAYTGVSNNQQQNVNQDKLTKAAGLVTTLRLQNYTTHLHYGGDNRSFVYNSGGGEGPDTLPQWQRCWVLRLMMFGHKLWLIEMSL